MEQEIYQVIQAGGWAVVAGLFIYKVLAPLVKHWISKLNGGNGFLWDKVEKVEKNHLTEINRRLDRHAELIKTLDDKIDRISDRVARIEGKLEG